MSSFGKLSPGRPSAGKSKDQLMESLKDTEVTKRVNFDLALSKHKERRIAAAKQSPSRSS